MKHELGRGDVRSNKGERGVEKRIAALTRITPIRGERLLDLGCGDGTFTRRFADSFDHVTAADVEPERLGMFRAAVDGTPLESKLVIREMPGEHLDLADGSVDMVTMIEVIEHVESVSGTLAEVHRVLTPGGRLLITTPNKWFPFETHGFLLFGKRRSPQYFPFLTWITPLHRRLADARVFTKKGLTRQAEAQGFRLVGSDYMMPPFDRSGLGGKIRKVTDRIERSRLKFFGMALILVFEKPR
jgi:ubiquinone/menaquinone biosynthesis C-methylase UbiE